MEMLDKQNKIINKLVQDGWVIDTVSYYGRGAIEAHKKYAELVITTEECMCHGGRMWINDKHTNQFYEITHDSYDESLGIVDSSTELEYIIEHEMMDYVNRYDSFIYKLTKINEFGTNSDGTPNEHISYHSSMENVARAVCSNDECKDIFAIDTVKYQPPNPDIYYITERIYKEARYSWEENRVWFKQTKYNRIQDSTEFEPEKSYEMYVEVFNKK